MQLLPVIPAESRNPVITAVRAFMSAMDYWVPARASPVEPGSLGRDDSPYATALPCTGEVSRHGALYCLGHGDWVTRSRPDLRAMSAPRRWHSARVSSSSMVCTLPFAMRTFPSA